MSCFTDRFRVRVRAPDKGEGQSEVSSAENRVTEIEWRKCAFTYPSDVRAEKQRSCYAGDGRDIQRRQRR
jgi:hypothetical protein